MNSVINQRKLRITGIFITIGLLAGLVYPVLGREILDPIAILNGLMIGLFGSLFLSFSELYQLHPIKKGIKFIPLVLLKTLYYSTFFILLILGVYSVNRSIFSGQSYFEYLRGPEFSGFIYEGDFNIIVGYTLIISAAIIFTHQMSLKMGQGVLLNLIFGKYHDPRREDRIFMFLDLNDSTSLAEKLGEIRYNQMMNEFFADITDPIVQYYGIIYRYVGDEVVVTWKLSKGIKNINCLRAFYDAAGVIKSKRENYLTKYGILPQFTAGFHVGSVVIGEVGDVKSQIVLSGSTLYEGQIIEKHCRKTGQSHLISEQLIQRLSLPKFYVSKYIEDVTTPSGSTLKLYTVQTLDRAS